MPNEVRYEYYLDGVSKWAPTDAEFLLNSLIDLIQLSVLKFVYKSLSQTVSHLSIFPHCETHLNVFNSLTSDFGIKMNNLYPKGKKSHTYYLFIITNILYLLKFRCRISSKLWKFVYIRVITIFWLLRTNLGG